jgi:hypothetical protein
MKKIALSSLMLLSAVYAAQGQRYFGVANSNWSGTYGVNLNPANIADSRTRIALDIFAVNFIVDNNLGKINMEGALNGSATGSDVFTYSNNKKIDLMFPAAEVRGPGVMYSINNENSIAITSRVRAYNQFNNFDKDFYRIITDPPNTGGATYSIVSEDFNWTANVTAEVKLSYGRVLYNKGEHFIKAGISVGRLGGLGFIGVAGDLDAQYYPASGSQTDSVVAKNTEIKIATNLIDSTMELAGGLGDILNDVFGERNGGGWSLDLGAVYEYRPESENSSNPGSNKYKVRASVAITDIGAMKYNTKGATVKGNGYMSSGEIADNFSNYGNFTTYANAHGFYLTDTGAMKTKVGLPTALVLGGDYHVASHLYVNGTLIMNVANRSKFGNSYYNQFTATPRWDTKFFSVGLPISYNVMSGMKVGLGIRLAGFVVGSDDVLFVGGRGANFYVGGYVPISKRNKKA